MIYILEGPNGVGKTTLAKYLVKNYGFMYHKDFAHELAALPPEYRMAATKEAIFAQAKLLKSIAPKCALIVDRFHLTEVVYGSVERGYLIQYQAEVEMMLQEVWPYMMLVYLTDSPERLQMRGIAKANVLINEYQKAYEASLLVKDQVWLSDGAESVMRALNLPYRGVPFKFGTGKEAV